MEIKLINEENVNELYDKYRPLIAFMELTKLNVNATINFLYLHIDQILSSQYDMEDLVND